MKLAKRFAVLAILLIGLFMNPLTDRAQAYFCYYCTTARQVCLNNCNALSPEEQPACRMECQIGYNDCVQECPY